jgi:hypothetical protein
VVLLALALGTLWIVGRVVGFRHIVGAR